jgi:aerobic C4-dicarboxylate transport protein
MARALGNLIGNCVATAVIAAWEKELDLLGRAACLMATRLRT